MDEVKNKAKLENLYNLLWENFENSSNNPRSDIQTAINIIGRRSQKQIDYENTNADANRAYQLDLTNCNLDGITFDGLNFDRTKFNGSSLNKCKFINTSLSKCSFESIICSNSAFLVCNLIDTDWQTFAMNNSRFNYCIFSGAKFERGLIDIKYFNFCDLNACRFVYVHFNVEFEDSNYIMKQDILFSKFTRSTDYFPTQQHLDLGWGQKQEMPAGLELPKNERWNGVFMREDWESRRASHIAEGQRQWDAFKIKRKASRKQ